MSNFVNALTVDVEDYLHVAALSKSIQRKDWDQYECRVENNTQRILDLFDEANFKGTFFVLAPDDSLLTHTLSNEHATPCQPC